MNALGVGFRQLESIWRYRKNWPPGFVDDIVDNLVT
jgi:hypothetical protein